MSWSPPASNREYINEDRVFLEGLRALGKSVFVLHRLIMDGDGVLRMVKQQARVEELAENILVMKGHILGHKQIISANAEALAALKKKGNTQDNVYMLWGNLFLRKNKTDAIETINKTQREAIDEVEDFEEKLRNYVTDLEILERGNSDRLKGHNLVPLSKKDMSYIKY